MGWIYLAPTVSLGLAVIRLLQAIAQEYRAIGEEV
ncbi:hypothetical protein CDEN61S_02515 [Castellaniella denitrificans]